MEKEEYPECEERGRSVNIRDDTTQGNCRIKDKRVDMKWSAWQAVVNATSEDFHFRRELLNEAAHGGFTDGKPEVRELKVKLNERDKMQQHARCAPGYFQLINNFQLANNRHLIENLPPPW